MLPYLAPIIIALLLVALTVYLDMRAARRPYEQALDELAEQERMARFFARVTQRVDRASKSRGDG